MPAGFDEMASIWNELLRLNGGSPELAMMMLSQLDDVQGRTVGEDVTRSPVPGPADTMRPRPRAPEITGPPPRPRMQNPMPIPRPAGGGYDPLSSMNVPTSGGGGGGNGSPTSPFPPTDPGVDLTRALGGPDMRDRFDRNLRDQLHGTPPPVSTPGQTGPIPPVGRVSDEFVPVPVPATPPTTPAVAAQPTPTVSSSNGGGAAVGPPMPRPNQQTMDGGIWAALRAAFANNAGNNERLALERMVASLGGGDRG